MRAPEEIVDRIATMDDPFGWQRPVLVECLDFEYARPFLIERATPEEWAREQCVTDGQAVDRIREYMPYAWRQVVEHHGRNANRSVEKLLAWLYVLEDDEGLVAMLARPFAMWGAPRLAFVCERHGFPIPSGRDVRHMREGKKCRRSCNRCGK